MMFSRWSKLLFLGIIIFLFCTVRIPAQTAQISPLDNVSDPKNVSVLNNNMQLLQNSLNSSLGQLSSFQTTINGYFSNGILSVAHGGTGSSNGIIGLSSTITSYSVGTVYQASTDGFVIAYAYSNGQGNGCFGVEGLSDSSSTPSTIIVPIVICANGQQGYAPLMMPVKKGNYWEVINLNGTPAYTGGTNTSVTINWTPMGV